VLLITQPDHARLAGRIMAHCAPLARMPRREAILQAIAEHDNGWTEEDASPGVDPQTGAIVDFVSAPLAIRHAVWPRAVQRLASNPWVAALVAQHAITVYERYRADREWDSFFARMESMRSDLIGAGGPQLTGLLEDYVFVRLGDLISLTFCTGWNEEQRFAQWTVKRSESGVFVAPDDFGGRTIPMEVEARQVPNRPFRTQAALADALRDASVVTLTGAVIPSAS
jgi:hypothetical protein